MKSLKSLYNGVEIPVLGLGVFRTEGEQTVNAVSSALKMGYNHIDTAQAYQNESEVGEGILKSELKRSSIFITTKVQNDVVRAGETTSSVEKSLVRLGTDYIDLLLIHWPVERRSEAWAEMEALYKKGVVKAIGVSNFHKHHLYELLKTAEIKPMINQFEMHPHLTQYELRKTCDELGIVCESWSPLGGIKGNSKNETIIAEIGALHGKTPAQIILRWHLQHGVVTIPKSTNPLHIKQNIEVFDFTLSPSEMASIDNLNKNKRVGSDPDNFNF